MGYIKRPISASVDLVHMIKKLVVFFVLSTLFFGAEAQNLEVGAFGGVSYYNGDLNPGIPFSKAKPVYGLLVRYSEGTRWAFRGNFTTGGIATDTKYARVQPILDTTIIKSISDLSVVAEFNFLDYFAGSDRDYLTPYLFIGFSLFGNAPYTYDTITGELDSKNLLGSLTFNNYSVPFGFGIKYNPMDKLSLNFEWKINKTINLTSNVRGGDDFDNISNVNFIYDDPNTKDWYFFTGVTVIYAIDFSQRIRPVRLPILERLYYKLGLRSNLQKNESPQLIKQ